MSKTATSPDRSSGRPGGAPRVWLVLGDKLGDNAQAELIAEALGWPCERKQLVFHEPYVAGKPRFKPSLYHVDLEHSDPLRPPWPDLIITIGRRPSMAAMWTKLQSGGRIKVVLLGRPKRMLDRFDLLIATPQYLLPTRPNTLHLDLPLMRGKEAGIAEAATAWKARLEVLPKPLVALLVGGPTKPYVFNEHVAKSLIDKAASVAADVGGTLYITTSRRTPAEVVDTLQSALPAGGILYRWTEGGEDNPYLALLGLADRFIVTGDSISMMVEVARTGRPLAIFPLPMEVGLIAKLRQTVADMLHSPEGERRPRRLLRWLGDGLYRIGLVGYSRDLGAIHRLLVRQGLAVWLGDAFPSQGRIPKDELGLVVERIKSMFDKSADPLR